MEDPTDAIYTVVQQGKPTGPFALAALKGMTILPETFVRKPGMDDYKEAHEFPELRELFGFGFQKTAPQYFASFDQRLLAMVIDYFFIAIGYVFLILLSYLFITEKGARITAGIMGLPLLPLVKLIYGSVAEASEKQATAGKALLNIRVCDLHGERISLNHAFGRNLAKVVSALPVCFGYLYSFLNRKQQCFHDLLAGTLVIKDRLL
ncbi:hypothetical protein PBAL39_23462 [Pedobacter sp. BAL39]|uniref:RDD family protein n=1 Tax=Pedobacter sp. BAL39 TaxID=391596 RepID=UPI000155920C|nr:RDD family protein [Pedobacter sp. BAL39]EDM36018.1 hypothetical protein PBAL39_23462 [Pedobacter sp. BAL39]